MTVPVLFARADSVYKGIPDCDVYDESRDALTWPGGAPGVFHPPCRGWGRLRTFAKVTPGEMDLARWSVDQVRRWGGVLEHPATSTLWADQGLPEPQRRDEYGGFTLPVLQKWWGHRAEKATWLYIVGIAPRDLPPIPLVLGDASHVVQTNRKCDPRPHITKAEREHTPVKMAKWLCDVARLCETA